MNASLEPKLYSWLVEIRLDMPPEFWRATNPPIRNSPTPNWTELESNKVLNIREKFKNAGFKLVEMPMDYYNPRSKRRFKAKHTDSAAMVMMLLGLREPPFTVVDENSYEENV